jgi:cardiolipin synthase
MKKKILIAILLCIAFVGLSFTPILGKTIPTAVSPELVVENYSGMIPIFDAIQNAKKSIHLEIYGFTQYDLARAIGRASARGIEVKVMFEKSPVGGDTENWNIKNMLRHYGVQMKWANPAYFLTHAKFLVVDGEKGYIFTGNFTYSTFHKNREFGIEVTDKDTVNEMEKIFESDWNREPVKEVSAPNLVLSPVNSRAKIESLIKSATKSIDIWQQEMEDNEINDLIEQEIKKGIKVRIIIPPLYRVAGNSYAVDQLGADHIKSLPDPYVHAKVIIVDGKSAYIGSNNFSGASLDMNREMGYITSDQSIISELLDLFKVDWNRSVDPNSLD